jgi:ankyrin repeat protein
MALHYAAERGDEGVLALLLDHGEYANIRNDDGMTPLMGACDEGHLGAVEMLVQHMKGMIFFKVINHLGRERATSRNLSPE